ncbi:MAG: M28 family peptidase [Bacteroidetes bacterium]|nr:M28 family peptidase [Bacteroidota bacterium]MCL5738385.1 M28 family peptidase [Bacteroidota bacterium]
MKKILLFLMLAVVVSSCSKRSPKEQAQQTQHVPQIPTVPIPQFDGKSAFNFLVQQVNFGPRNPNSDAHDQCLLYLQQEFSMYADSVELQKFDVPGYNGVVLHLTNIIAHFNMKSKTRVLLSAHWDSRPRADHQPGGPVDKPIPGADDGASGVAVLLEMARDFKQSPPPEGVDMILWDGEDYGKEGSLDYYFLGSKYWAATKPFSYQPIFAINLDMIGSKGLVIPKEGFSVQYAPDVVDLVWKTAAEIGVPQFVDRVGDPIYDDHLELDNIGIKAIDIIDFDYKYWHTLEDTPDKCSPESLSAVGRVLLQVLYRRIPL